VNKAQLIEELSSRFDGNKREAQRALEHVLDVITRSVAKGEKVAITGFGVFEKVERAARTARNPQTGEPVKLKRTQIPKFRPGAELKAVVSGAKKLPRVAASTAKSAAGAATSAAKKATGKKAAPAKKTAARKTTAKKTTAKKSTAKKTTGRKTTAKKTAKR
jgi:DNA-binding protein HU-beta